jgi:penicillin-binding protein 2
MFREQNREVVEKRAGAFYMFSLAIILLLTVRIWYLQVESSHEFSSKSENNSVRIKEIVPARGRIFDINGSLLVDNRPAYSLAVLPAEVPDSVLHKVSGVLVRPMKDIKEKIRKSNRHQPVVIERFLSDSLVIHFEENLSFYPGISIISEGKRHYPDPQVLAHILGYIGEVDEKTVNNNKAYDAGDIAGVSGIEKIYDQQLRGQKGYRYFKIDVRGRYTGEIESRYVPAKAAKDAVLTIDKDMQAFVENEMHLHRGSAIVIEPATGSIRAIVSKPDYSPDVFAEQISQTNWKTLVNDPEKPLTNRPVQGTYPPGSTYKMITTIAALENNVVSKNWAVECNGSFQIGNRVLYCWNHKGHGKVSMNQALAYSCNVYFYNLALKLRIDQWHDVSQRFGFGQKVNLDVIGEHSGLLPSGKYYQDQGWKLSKLQGVMANLNIGQGELLVTLAQMAKYTSILANNGKYTQLHLLDAFVDSGSDDSLKLQWEQSVIDVDAGIMRFTRNAMRNVVKWGTAASVALKKVEIAGKTGTAQNPHGEAHSWFLCFAPYDNPEIAIVTMVENGGSGSGLAARIARSILEKHFFGFVDINHRLYLPKPKEEEVIEELEIKPLF